MSNMIRFNPKVKCEENVKRIFYFMNLIKIEKNFSYHFVNNFKENWKRIFYFTNLI